MPSMILNGQQIELTIQTQETLGSVLNALLPLIAAKEPLVPSIGGVLGQGLASGQTMTDAPIQWCLWLLHEMGVRALTIPQGGTGGSIDKVLSAEERARDISDPYSQGNIATGRALAMALANISSRIFVLNGEPRDVKLMTRDKMEPAMQAVVDMRRLNEPIHITTTRALASLISSNVAKDDERIDAVVSLISDLGVVGISIDVATSTITFDGLFSEANAAASAYLQGGGVNGVLGTRQRIRNLNSQMQSSGGGAAGQGRQDGRNAGASDSKGGDTARPSIKSLVKPRRRR
ncbi:MAG: hypothetical protein NTY97_02295 [Planctomycetota bacterium]|nr:hypothetical protein [Planctomycetota bacterium]